MNISEKKLDNATVELQIEVPIERVEIEYKAVFEKIRKTAKIDGFRKGKSPVQLVEAKYQEYADDEVAQNLVRSIFVDAVTQKEMTPITEPKYDYDKINREDQFSFKATFEIPPSTELGKYKDIAVEERACNIAGKDVTKEIDAIREKSAKITKKEAGETVENGNSVKIMLKRIDDVKEDEIDNLEYKDFTFVVGKSKTDYTFDDHVLGMKMDEEKEVQIKYPKDYYVPDLKGQKATYKLKIAEINDIDLPELNDEFAKTAGYESADDMNVKVKEYLEKFVADKTLSESRADIIKNIVENSKFDIPMSLITNEMMSIFKKTQERVGYFAEDIDQFAAQLGFSGEEFKDRLKEEAEQSVQTTLILSEISKSEKLEVSEQKYKEVIESIAQRNNKSVEEVESLIEKNNSKRNIENELLLDASMNFIYENAKIKKLKAVPLEDLMKK